ncbi:hypothetical protein HPB50_001077 [Hyalomma asiaticum]|uniref:Uncharacterized protein n=1 Tax=Hyalomma asiaticum TaxID=266040 RepID=A0ACB7RLT5_HYAAI|nr:hypothetical protein HPB50_001077 [Hyalomma asiaticum]
MNKNHGRRRPGKAEAAQILRFKEDGSLELDEDRLRGILLRDHVKEKPVVVVSIAGAYRKGKSFLLNFFLRYMRKRCQDDWMGDQSAPLKGFSWRGGSKRDTTGILLWDEVFLVPTSDGQEAAVLLMDTQGTFDTESSVREWTTIFALSTLMSSVQVYNLSKNIQGDDIENLQLFAEYGRMAQQLTGRELAQKLLFLVRDWSYPYEASYGAGGGELVLRRLLPSDDKQCEQNMPLRKHLRSCFSEIACFLMPHPGLKVATQQSFDGRLSDIEPHFIAHLKDLVQLVLGRDHLLVKKINGQAISCQEFVTYLKAYVGVFGGGQLPQPKSVLEATLEATNLAAKDKARSHYMNAMYSFRSSHPGRIHRSELEAYHARLRAEAIDLFQRMPKMGDEECARRYMAILESEIEKFRDDFFNATRNNATFFDKPAQRFLQVGAVIVGAAAVAPIIIVELPIIAIVSLGAVATACAGSVLASGIVEYIQKKTATANDPGAAENVTDSTEQLTTEAGSSGTHDAVELEDSDSEEGAFAGGSLRFTDDSLEGDADSISQRSCDTANSPAIASALSFYTNSMEQLVERSRPSLSPQLLQSIHKRQRERACHLLASTSSNVDAHSLKASTEELGMAIDSIYENICNLSKRK